MSAETLQALEHLDLGELERAEELLARHENAESLAYRGMALHLQGKDGTSLWEQALTAPGEGWRQDAARGLALLALGRPHAAQERLKPVVESHPDAGEATYLLAKALFTLGDLVGGGTAHFQACLLAPGPGRSSVYETKPRLEEIPNTVPLKGRLNRPHDPRPVDIPDPGLVSAEQARDLIAAIESETDPRRLHGLAVTLFDLTGSTHGEVLARAVLRAAEAGVAEAWVDVGRCRWNGWGFPGDPERAMEDYKRAARAGSDQGAYVAAFNLYHVFQQDEEAHQFARLALKGGDPDGRVHYLLGLMAFNGRGCDKNVELAISFYQTAASRNDGDAMFELYCLHQHGVGLPRDERRGLEWLRKAADFGQMRACYNLGALYATGTGLEQSWDESVRWYGRASELGHIQASFTLGWMFLSGQGPARNLERARTELLRALMGGFPVFDQLYGNMGLDEDTLDSLALWLDDASAPAPEV